MREQSSNSGDGHQGNELAGVVLDLDAGRAARLHRAAGAIVPVPRPTAVDRELDERDVEPGGRLRVDRAGAGEVHGFVGHDRDAPVILVLRRCRAQRIGYAFGPSFTRTDLRRLAQRLEEGRVALAAAPSRGPRAPRPACSASTEMSIAEATPPGRRRHLAVGPERFGSGVLLRLRRSASGSASGNRHEQRC